MKERIRKGDLRCIYYLTTCNSHLTVEDLGSNSLQVFFCVGVYVCGCVFQFLLASQSDLPKFCQQIC